MRACVRVCACICAYGGDEGVVSPAQTLLSDLAVRHHAPVHTLHAHAVAAAAIANVVSRRESEAQGAGRSEGRQLAPV